MVIVKHTYNYQVQIYANISLINLPAKGGSNSEPVNWFYVSFGLRHTLSTL